MRRFFAAAGAVLFIIMVCSVNSRGGEDMAFTLTSPDIKDGSEIPKKFTCDGSDVSPELVWEGAPAGTKSYCMIVDDPDAPVGTFTHWVVYDIPSSTAKLKGGAELKDGMKAGQTNFGKAAWGGPCPPRGHGKHRYFFMLMALDLPTLGLPAAAARADVEKALKGHILGTATLMGVYKR